VFGVKDGHAIPIAEVTIKFADGGNFQAIIAFLKIKIAKIVICSRAILDLDEPSV
jgi:hypothetical protein